MDGDPIPVWLEGIVSLRAPIIMHNVNLCDCEVFFAVQYWDVNWYLDDEQYPSFVCPKDAHSGAFCLHNLLIIVIYASL